MKSDPKNRRVIIRLDGSAEATRRGVRQAFYFIGKDLVRTVRTEMSKPKSGRVYVRRREGRRRRHVASSPEEYPASDTGATRKGIGFVVQGSNKMEFGHPNAQVPYDEPLELKEKLRGGRPFLIRAINDNERNTENHFEEQIKKELTE